MKKGLMITWLSAIALSLALSSCKDETVSEITLDNQAIGERSGSPYEAPGAIYLIDNDANANRVMRFDRSYDGSLSNKQAWLTGGLGTGGGLGSQGAVIRYRNYLLVVNAGSNEISVFRVFGSSLMLTDVEPSQGIMPVSLTASRNLVYVLNAGGDGNIAGFSLNSQGGLDFIPGSAQPLSSSAAGGAQIAFDFSGRTLVVTEKATNTISVYSTINPNGVAGPPTTYQSAGNTPFGFDFGRANMLFVSEAFGGAAGASTLSSYRLNPSGNLELIDGPVATLQTAACWAVVSNDGKYTYTTNTGSASVTGFSISPSGYLELLDESGVSGTTGAGPIDAGFSPASNFLYTLNAGSDSITMFAVDDDGSLTNIGEWEGLPDGAAGLAVD